MSSAIPIVTRPRRSPSSASSATARWSRSCPAAPATTWSCSPPIFGNGAQCIAAGRDETAPATYLEDHRRLLDRLRAEPALDDRVQVTKFNRYGHPVAQGRARISSTLRNLRNLDGAGRRRGVAAGLPSGAQARRHASASQSTIGAARRL
jgi:hypothetical protein